MFGRITLALALGFATLTAQTLPDRPEKLTYPPLAFQVPKAKDFKTKLKNDIPVYLSDDATGAPVVRLSIHWKGGSYMEPDGKEGVAGLFGSLLSQGGSTKMAIAKQVDLLEDLAASVTSTCGDTSGSISMQCMEKDFNAVFGMMIDIFTQPAFPQDRLELFKRNIKQSQERLNDSVTSIASYQMSHLLRGEDHFTVKNSTPASIDSITRDDLLAFYSRILHPSNFLITISGKFNRKTVLDRLNATLGSMKPAKDAQVSPNIPAPEFTRKPGIYVVDKAAPQAMVQWAFPGMRRSDQDWYAASVMNHILGGSFTGRLMQKIRSDEGLTYGIGSSLSEGAHWTGDFSGNSQTNNNTVAYLLRLAIAEMETLKNVPLTDTALQTVKDGLVDSFPSRWNKSAAASILASEAMAGWPEDWWVNYREKIQAVTPSDIQRMARQLLDMDKVIILAVGQADLIEAGDHDHPGLLKDILPLQVQRLPLRDPNTRKPM
ncbi:MAG: insulinase family protein [Holophagales bacterium]|jgi:zinc protease|nr:insulinase family protein [Holophagales bacterium]